MKSLVHLLVSSFLISIIANSSLKALYCDNLLINRAKSTTATICSELWNWRMADTAVPGLEELNIVTLRRVPAVSEGTPIARNKKATIEILEAKRGFIGFERDNKSLEVYEATSGIPTAISRALGPVTVIAGGYSGPCYQPRSYSAASALNLGVISGDVVVHFTYATNTRRRFNFCQQQDQQMLIKVLTAINQAAPKKPIVLYGSCQAGANNLRFLAEQAERAVPNYYQVVAVISESPPISPAIALKSWYNGGMLTAALLLLVLPNYRDYIFGSGLKTIMHTKAFPSHIPVLVGSLSKDSISGLSEIKDMVKHLQNQGGAITHLISKTDHLKHGFLRQDRDFQASVRDFYARNKALLVDDAP